MTTIDPDFESAAAAYFKEIGVSGIEEEPVGPSDETPETPEEIPEPEPGVDDEPEATPEEDPDPGQVTPEPEPEPDPFEGMSKDQILAYKKFDTILKTNPELELLIARQLGLAPPAPAPVAEVPLPQLPEFDMDDPAIRYLVQHQQELEQRLGLVTNTVIQNNQSAVAQQTASNQAILNRAFESFKTSHALNDEDFQRVADAAGRLNVLPSLLRGIDPMTGSPTQPDPLSAVERALDIAYWQFPDLRAKEVGTLEKTRRTAAIKKQKVGALSGNSGSAPRRNAPIPTDEAGRRKAMVEYVSGLMDGSASVDE